MKRHTSSTCPWVSSPAMPLPSHNTFVTPSWSRSARSSSARDRPGFRTCTAGSSRLLGGQERATTVHVDAPAFQHHVAVAEPSPPQPHSEPFRSQLRHLVVAFPVGILRPGVEAEPRDGELGLGGGPDHEERTKIAGPTPVGGEAEEFQPRGIDTDLPEHASRPALMRGRIHENTHDLAGHHLADDLAVHPLDRRELTRPIACVIWPADPGGVVWLPFGWHAEPL